MKTENLPVIGRRELFRGTATLLGGAAIGLLPNVALGQIGKSLSGSSSTLVPSPSSSIQSLSIGFWDGRKFVSADGLTAGDVTLEKVRLTVSSSQGGGLKAIEANALVPMGRAIQKVPFTLWVTPPAGAAKTSAVVPTSVGEGVSLNAFAGNGMQTVTLRTDSVAGPKLREGTYAIVSGRADWASLSLDASGQLVSGGRPVSTPNVLIAVARS